ncbi:MAG: ABC transporter ATP-binding protein [Canidatus Methanoxibalbensis ujae]|nr:ABC transporter ATP-binding protein [Candidatus Methanoxibalbensis ujae]
MSSGGRSGVTACDNIDENDENSENDKNDKNNENESENKKKNKNKYKNNSQTGKMRTSVGCTSDYEKCVLDVRNVSKRYGHFFALKSVSFSVRAGESVAVLGPNGAGKTTLLKIIATLIKPSEGVVKLFGRDSSNADIRRRIGVVMHESFLYDELTVLENLKLYAKFFYINSEQLRRQQAEEEIEALVDILNLKRWLNVKAKLLSYGLRKRADIARALIHRPDLVILDEPFGGLDASSREILVEYFSRCSKTLILSSHSVEWARKVCERGIILERGAVKREMYLKRHSA